MISARASVRKKKEKVSHQQYEEIVPDKIANRNHDEWSIPSVFPFHIKYWSKRAGY